MSNVRDFPTELADSRILDPRIYRRLQQLYELIYQLQQAQVAIPSQTVAAVTQRLQLLGVLREPLIGGEIADPQLAAAAQSPGTGTVTSISASSGAPGFALAATPSPIIGAGNIAFSVTNAATARATLGIITAPLNNPTAVVAPTVTDDSSLGYSIFSLWLDTTGPTTYICRSAAIGAADWKQID